MTIARKHQISLDCTPYYHCVSRCVRRAFLCGKDKFSGKSFEHRRDWIEQRILSLAEIFSIDVCAYAVMSNHYHLVVRLDPKRAVAWSDDEVVHRWSQVFQIPLAAATSIADHENLHARKVWINRWRTRLSSLSWFMRCINEPLARRSNREDQCTGRFWEGRFKLQALLDEAALIQCMAYVDLNPVRSGLAETPQTSLHTSVHARIQGRDQALQVFAQNKQLATVCLPIAWADYLQLVDWTGRQWQPGKFERIDPTHPPILDRLGSDANQWINQLKRFNSWHGRALGSIAALQVYCDHLGQRWLKGLKHHLKPAHSSAARA